MLGWLAGCDKIKVQNDDIMFQSKSVDGKSYQAKIDSKTEEKEVRWTNRFVKLIIFEKMKGSSLSNRSLAIKAIF